MLWDLHLWSGSVEALTASDGPFPLAEEDVEHFGTVQQLGMKDLVLCQDVTRAEVFVLTACYIYCTFFLIDHDLLVYTLFDSCDASLVHSSRVNIQFV